MLEKTLAPERDQYLNQLTQFFKFGNKFMVLMWHLGLGRMINIAPRTIGRIMVLIHTGRKTGKIRKTPLNYAIVEGEIYCMAGFGARSQWYKNIMANPAIEVWLPTGWWKGHVEDVTSHPDRHIILREILIASGFAAKTFEGIEATKLSRTELEDLIDNLGYRLLHIHLDERRHGQGGPGTYAWVWMIPIALILARILSRRIESLLRRELES